MMCDDDVGVLISLALIHVLGPGIAELSNSCNPSAFLTYSYAPMYCMVALIIMQTIESLALDYARSHTQEEQQAEGWGGGQEQGQGRKEAAAATGAEKGHLVTVKADGGGGGEGDVVGEGQTGGEKMVEPPLSLEKSLSAGDVELVEMGSKEGCERDVHPHDYVGHTHGSK